MANQWTDDDGDGNIKTRTLTWSLICNCPPNQFHQKMLVPAVQVVELCFGFWNWSKASWIVLSADSIAVPNKIQEDYYETGLRSKDLGFIFSYPYLQLILVYSD